ncbi:MAG: PmeII family type II restriction endonuclease [Thermomicrobiales bacterium]
MSEEELERLVRDALKTFYDRRIQALDKLELKKVLVRKNPYLSRARCPDRR